MPKLPFFSALLILCLLDYAISIGLTVTESEWIAYKQLYDKDYSNSAVSEAYARYYYSYNKRLIENHNLYYQRGLRSFGLRINQFTDMRLTSFTALFPDAIRPSEAFNSSLPKLDMTLPVLDTFDPIEDLGFNTTVEDQGTACNSGWAYAAAKSIELLNRYQSGIMESDTLSAQNLIDCAGQSRGCRNQVPQTAYDYLTRYNQELYYTNDYPNRNEEAQQGMCISPSMPQKSVTLQEYAFINDGDDATMKRYIAGQYPVIIEFSPASFEFMHYAEGIFQQPRTSRGSHFMVVIGYGVNETSKLNYFIVQNSFGTTWGEEGLIKIAYSKVKPLAKSAMLPTT